MENNAAKILFWAQFNDGYTFRNLVEYLKKTNVDGNFLFSRKQIIYRMADATQAILNDIEINTSEIRNYIYNVTDEQGVEISNCVVGFSLQGLQTITKQIQKKDGLNVYMFQNDKDGNLYLQPVSQNAQNRDNNPIKYVKAKVVDLIDYNIGEYAKDENNPNCTVTMSEFSQMCANIVSIKSDYVIVTGYPKGIKLEAQVDGGLNGCIQTFGTISDEVVPQPRPRFIVRDELGQIVNQFNSISLNANSDNTTVIMRFRKDTFKSLAKLKNAAPNGANVKITMEEGKPLRIIIPIGTYAKARIYLSNIIPE